jgi:PLAT/LH2 domain
VITCTLPALRDVGIIKYLALTVSIPDNASGGTNLAALHWKPLSVSVSKTPPGGAFETFYCNRYGKLPFVIVKFVQKLLAHVRTAWTSACDCASVIIRTWHGSPWACTMAMGCGLTRTGVRCRWLSSHQEDGQSFMRVLSNVNADAKAAPLAIHHSSEASIKAVPAAFSQAMPLNTTASASGRPSGGYRVTFATKNLCMAGTSAVVSFQLLGSLGASETYRINAQHAGLFARGSRTVLEYRGIPYVGDICGMRVGTSGGGAGLASCASSAWHLREVVVHCLASRTTYTFVPEGPLSRQNHFSLMLRRPAARTRTSVR